MTTLTLTPTVHHTDTRITCAGCATRVYAYADQLDAEGRAVRHYCTTCAHRLRGTTLCRGCQRPITPEGTGWVHTEPTRWGGKHTPTPEPAEWADVHADGCQCGCQEPTDPAYQAYVDDMERREAEGRPWPIGEMMPCWNCRPQTDVDKDGAPCVMRECTGLGPVVNRADPTQTYLLACGHGTI
jgi:hypothetical protein